MNFGIKYSTAFCAVYLAFFFSQSLYSASGKNESLKVGDSKFIELQNYPDGGSAINTLRSGLFFVRDTASAWDKLSPFYKKFYQRRISGELQIFKRHPAVKYNLWLSDTPGDIVFIIPGTGESLASFGSASFANLFNSNGYSVVVVSNSFNWEFMESAGSTVAPGCVYYDALDVVRVLKKLIIKLEKDYPHHFKRRILLGTSMGAMQVLYINNHCVSGKKPIFDRYVAINPPVDMLFAMSRINNYYHQGAKWKKEDISKKVKKCIVAYMNLLEGNSPDAAPIESAHDKATESPTIVNETYERPVTGANEASPSAKNHTGINDLNSRDAEFLIGLSFHIKLVEVIYSIFMRGLTDAVKAKKSYYDQREIYKEIEKFDFDSYFDKILLPSFKKLYGNEMDLKEISQKSNLKYIEDTLKRDKSIRVFHNQDDFLLSNDDKIWLKKVFGERLTFFSKGGHLGNLYLPEVQQHILNAVKE